MFYSLEGKIETIGKNWVAVNVNGVGYKVFVSSETLSKMPQLGLTVKILTSLEVKEDAMNLYGFLSKEEVSLFELLCSISGIGPKTAMGILSLAPTSTIASAIASKNVDFLTKVSGVGRKMAEKVILELKDKIKDLGIAYATNITTQTDADLIEALTKIGYSVKESAEVLSRIPEKIADEQERLKEALKLLNRR